LPAAKVESLNFCEGLAACDFVLRNIILWSKL
jgi:hypothetical protein